jgi:7 transmembrane sweet-taste receptor of 3 GCPR
MKLQKAKALLLSVVLPFLALAQGNDDSNTTSTNQKNPYSSGCLQAKLENWTRLRICNSDDDPIEAIGILCQPPQFDNYLEIRIQPRNWDSILILSWLTQIILSELLGVPTTLEGGPEHSQALNFYAPQSPTTLTYPMERDFEVVATPMELPHGDCRLANRGVDSVTGDYDYQYCAHFIPELWDADSQWLTDMVLKGTAEPPQGVGILGKNTWFVTKFTAVADPTVDSYYGLAGEQNRRKLAETFLRPTTWKDYCEQVSPNNCTTPDTVAQRPPQDETEHDRFFVAGQYTGHFRKTSQNDCDANPTNCTGHIANFPCSWQSRMSATLYHLDIALSNTDGPHDYGSYTVEQQIELWDAANATKSNLMMLWWTPEPLYHRYLGTDAELQRVQLNAVTSDCMEGRWETANECSDDLQERLGSTTPQGICEEPPRLLQKLMSGNLQALTQQYEPAIQSPAYDVLRRFQFTEHQLGEIFQFWQSSETPRDAVCTWAADNIDFLKRFVPYSYPREAKEERQSTFGIVLIALSALSTVLTLIFCWQIHSKRNLKSLQYAQLGFLWLLLAGALLVSIGSILNSVPATNGTCVATIWFINIGYSMELVPLIVKVAAINQMMAAAKKMSRITLTHRQLYGAVAVILAFCTIYLAIWTAIDPPRKVPEYSLTETITDSGATLVGVKYYCRESSLVWQYLAVGWNTVLLMCAAVLAFQTRSIVKAFNESVTLALLISFHFLCVLLRCGTFLMSDIWRDTVMIQVRSLLYSVDTMVTLLIYFLPKLMAKNNLVSHQSRYISGIEHSSMPDATSQVPNGMAYAASSIGHQSSIDSDYDDEYSQPREKAKSGRRRNKRNKEEKSRAKMLCPTCAKMCPHCAMEVALDGEKQSLVHVPDDEEV